jgi:O-antigen biosynthesis protein WbqP
MQVNWARTNLRSSTFPAGSPVAGCQPLAVYRLKRFLDLFFGGVFLLVAGVPLALIAAAIWLDSGAPVFIRQRRIGLCGTEYFMFKFRTLPRDTPQAAKSELAIEARNARPLGRFLRRYSLDELPQLANVMRGDMSLVGPRPALYTQLDLTELRREAGVLRVRPGLTGIAQVSGREALDLSEKVRLDAQYTRNVSLLLDLAILIRTATAVVRARGSF